MAFSEATIRLAARSADAFFARARSVVEKLSTSTRHHAGRYATDTLEEVVVAATNLGLSIELYMKTLWMLAGKKPPKGSQGHQLFVLFEGLPEDLKNSIDAQYATVPPRPAGMGSTCRVTATETVLRIDVRDTPSNKTTDSRSLREVLRRSEDVFVSWRYFHELSKPASDLISFEFFDLNAIAEILKSETERAALTLAGRGLWVLHKGE